jgi:hypothetical protein
MRTRVAEPVRASPRPNAFLLVIEQVAMAMLAGDTLEKILLFATESP